MPRHFLRDTDLSPAEQTEVLELAAELKTDRWRHRALAGPQTATVIFDKTSTRTRYSFAAGIADLGGSPMIVNPGEAQLGAKESIADTARVISRMVGLIVWRTYDHAGLEEMAQNSHVPVINALSDDFHPCQILADLLTIREHFGATAGHSFAYLGDAANNMSNSYLLGMATAGMHVRIAGPAGYLPEAEIVTQARERAELTGGSVMVTEDPAEALAGADVVCTDTWVSMGQEEQTQARAEVFRPYSIDAAAMDQADPQAVFMHCLPAYRGKEVSAEVIDGPRSLVFQEAENRLHAQKALMVWLLAASGRYSTDTGEVSLPELG